MSKDRTRKNAAPEPMDVSAREDKNPVAAPNHQRVCYALKTLVSEVLELFPETPVEYSNYDGRNTALDAQFDLSALDGSDGETFVGLINLVSGDARVADVLIEHDSATNSVLVSMVSNPRTQDSREPFGLADALDVLAGDEEGSV